MQRAIELAKNGFPAPNPRVGCVIAQEGVVVAEGFHDHAGGPHAEAAALQQAGEAARGADVYLTLEPCNHQGRTPPCAQALVKAQVARVVYAVSDPNPGAGGGAATLRQAGIATEPGLLAAEATEAASQFHFFHRHSRPLVALKAAVTLDGRVAWPDGTSKWITGEDARAQARLLRAEYGAVLVGCRTVLADDPALTTRDARAVNEPLRVVLDPSGVLTGQERVFRGPGRVCWLVSEAQSSAHTQLEDFTATGIVLYLGSRGCTGVMVEGGPVTWSRFAEAGLADRLELFMAPVAFGSGPTWLAADGGWPPHGKRWRLDAHSEVGTDLWLRLRATS